MAQYSPKDDIGITALGTLAPDGTATHGVPPLAAQIDALVKRLDDEAVRRFHRAPGGGIQLGYVPLLLSAIPVNEISSLLGGLTVRLQRNIDRVG